MFIYFEMYKNTYSYMYFYTFFNNNTMHLIVLLLKTPAIKNYGSKEKASYLARYHRAS